MTARMAMAIAPFVKLDTLVRLTESLLVCDLASSLSLVFLQDSVAGNRHEERYEGPAREVRAFLDEFASTHGTSFAGCEVLQNEKNEGPYRTCQFAIDRAFDSSDFVIFSEDDAVYARDALRWFAFGRDELLGRENIAALAAESIYFRTPGALPAPDKLAEIRRQADRNGLANRWFPINWVPSTSFAVRREDWERFGELRGRMVGDIELGQHFQRSGLWCAQPVVPRMRDIGMVHPLGHTALHHGVANVADRKTVLLTSDDLALDARRFDRFDGRHGWIAEWSIIPAAEPALPSMPVAAPHPAPPVSLTEALSALHHARQPRLYLETGARGGETLPLAACRAIGVYPAPVREAASRGAELHISTPEAFFQREDVAEALGGPIDLATIGLWRTFPGTLRDFIAIERLANPDGAIVIRGVLPPDLAAAQRIRGEGLWCGDVWQIVDCLTAYRPDLSLSLREDDAGGQLLVTHLDPENMVLAERMAHIIALQPADGSEYDQAYLAYRASAADR
ncbi:MAG: hypothetical protein ACR2J8_08605 [Thermomicrobiales bacterium]